MCRRTYIQPIELLNISSAWIWRGVRAKYVEHEAVLIFQLNFVQESPAESLGRIWIAFDWLSDWCWVISHVFHPNITKFSCFSSLEEKWISITFFAFKRYPCGAISFHHVRKWKEMFLVFAIGKSIWMIASTRTGFHFIFRVKYVKRLIQTNTTTWFVICEPWN